MPGPAALITGGTSGIGQATAGLLHQRGYQVVVTGQNPETIAVAEKSLPAQIVVVRADARSLADAASRGALLALVPSLALELAPRRIRVNAAAGRAASRYRPAALRRFSARSVRSQEKSGSSRPKCP